MALWYYGYSRKNNFSWENNTLRLFFLCFFKHFFGTLKIGQNDPKITNLEFKSHGFLQNQVFLPKWMGQNWQKKFVRINQNWEAIEHEQ